MVKKHIIKPERIRLIRKGKNDNLDGPVIYWMSRDQRIDDNWAVLCAQNMALERHKPLEIVFCIVPRFEGAAWRQYDFMLKGLAETEKRSAELNITFKVLEGEPSSCLPAYLSLKKCSVLVTDFDPLKIKKQWLEEIAQLINIPLYQVDAHNITPCWIASKKQEYSAYTFRRKTADSLREYCDNFGIPVRHPFSSTVSDRKTDWELIKKSIMADRNIQPVSWIKPGRAAAKKTLGIFIRKRLHLYSSSANDPTSGVQSDLSAYIHFGQIAAQRIALEIKGFKTKADENILSFLEQLVVRRELADNFCNYNDNYDSLACAAEWAKKTLETHRRDRREYLYGVKQFEEGTTHDSLWNAAQNELVVRGKMHGYMRMYWAKKILEWSETPEEAIEKAIYLNDRYELDGRDPNGYAGIMWSICGIHDRAWAERPIYGKIRYINYSGCRRKFSVEKYISSNTRRQ
jgi:deoxyribodipyrimidine photo-lyase